MHTFAEEKHRPMKRITTVIAIVLATLNLNAQNVTLNEARQVARKFLEKHHDQVMSCPHIDYDGNEAVLYIFNGENSFVAVSGDKNTQPILAYVDANTYDESNIVAPAKMWLDNYSAQIKSVKKQQFVSPENQQKWASLLEDRAPYDDTLVPPMLTSKWGQSEQYNFYCPSGHGGPNGHAVTGCVATAMSQLIYFFRFPESGIGSYSYEHPDYGTISADFSSAHYDYDAMTDQPDNINLAASLINFHCGVAVDMVYGPDASGMYNHKAAYALRNYFKFNPETEYLFRDSTNLNWDSTVVSHLDRNIPMYYAGWSAPWTEGHAFIVDGYIDQQDDYYFHFNFGWDGSYDGYYYTTALNPGYNFNLAQELIINAWPDATQYTYPTPVTQGNTTFLTESGSFTDGSGPFEGYGNNVDYTWVVRPSTDLDSISSLRFNLYYDLAENDTITVEGEGIHQAFTNDSSIFSMTNAVKELTVRLHTNSEGNGSGIKANWVSDIPSYCSGGNNYTQPSGHISDGSGNYRYNNFTSCNKLIYVKNAHSITLHFTRFETEADHDYLRIYTRNNQTVPVAELSGDLGEMTYTYNTDGLLLKFSSDEANVFDGYELDYDADLTNTDDDFAEAVNIRPNPARDILNIESDGFMNSVSCFDLSGRCIMTSHPDTNQTNLKLNDLPNGIYYLKIETSDSVIVKKFVKE